MSSSAHVRSVYALEDLKVALGRFGGAVQEGLDSAERDIWRTARWLEDHAQHWRTQVQMRHEIARQAATALARCQASGSYDEDGRYHAPDCSAYERALRVARASLLEAEEELRVVQHWTRKIELAVTEYRKEAHLLKTMLGHDLLMATAFLGREAATLRAYASLGAPSCGPFQLTSPGPATSVPVDFSHGFAGASAEYTEVPTSHVDSPRGGTAEQALTEQVRKLKAEVEAREATELTRMTATEVKEQAPTAHQVPPTDLTSDANSAANRSQPETGGSIEVERRLEGLEGSSSGPERGG